MCRRGTPESVKHCYKCGYCVPLASNHKCLENNAASRCPVCLQDLHFSTKGYIPMKCGHLIHQDCWMQLKDINCPTCGMANHKMSKKHIQQIDQQIQKTKEKLPQQVKDMKVNAMCNECLHKTMNAPFHYYGVKCEDCGSYNTKLI